MALPIPNTLTGAPRSLNREIRAEIDPAGDHDPDQLEPDLIERALRTY